jgi:hypothetical protein
MNNTNGEEGPGIGRAQVSGSVRPSERPSLIIVDDPENDNHVTSALQRVRSWSWFSIGR